jgi:uncharacterized protein YcfJ
MRKLIMMASALSVAMPVAVVLPATSAQAQNARTYPAYRGRDGRYYCKRRGGTTGALIGGAGGALIGSALGGTTATILGAAGGALAGREVERGRSQRRCRYGR